MSYTAYNYIRLTIDDDDFTEYLSAQIQEATNVTDNEIGRAAFAFIDTGSLPAISQWAAVRLYAGTTTAEGVGYGEGEYGAGGYNAPLWWSGLVTRITRDPLDPSSSSAIVIIECQSDELLLMVSEPVNYIARDTTDHELVGYLVDTFTTLGKSISTASPDTITAMSFDNVTLAQALQQITDRTGKAYRVDDLTGLVFGPASTTTYSTKLSDDPDESTTFPMHLKPSSQADGIAIRNAVRVIGGWQDSADITEEFDGDGVTTEFVISHVPSKIVSVTVDGVNQTVGVDLVDDPDVFDCLVHYDDRKFTFYNEAPGVGTDNVDITYRYSERVSVDRTNAGSISALGRTIWGPTIEDPSIRSTAEANSVGDTYLASVASEVTTSTITTNYAGEDWRVGDSVYVTADALGWDDELVAIERVTLRAIPRIGGAGNARVEFDLDVGKRPSLAKVLSGGSGGGTVGANVGTGQAQQPAEPIIDLSTDGITFVHGGNLVASTVTAAKINVSELSAITADMGTLTAGEIRMYTGTWDDDATGFRLTEDEIAGQNAGTDQVNLAAATGKLTAGAGAVTLDEDGIQISTGSGDVNKLKWVNEGTAAAVISSARGADDVALFIYADGTQGEAWDDDAKIWITAYGGTSDFGYIELEAYGDGGNDYTQIILRGEDGNNQFVVDQNDTKRLTVVEGVTKVGDPDGGNYAEFSTSGTLALYGDATYWDDVSVAISSVRVPTSSAPTWTAYKGGYVLAFGPSADEIIYFSVQLPHKYKHGSAIEFHIHTVYPDSNSGNVQWNFTYSWANIGDDFPTATTVPVTIAASEDADAHTLDEIEDAISGTGKTLSSVLLCSLEREGTNGADTYANSVYLVSLDFHVECDTLGSNTEVGK